MQVPVNVNWNVFGKSGESFEEIWKAGWLLQKFEINNIFPKNSKWTHITKIVGAMGHLKKGS